MAPAMVLTVQLIICIFDFLLNNNIFATLYANSDLLLQKRRKSNNNVSLIVPGRLQPLLSPDYNTTLESG